MGTVDKIKARMNPDSRDGVIAQVCPICGAAPKLEKHSLDRGNGHGYPGYFTYQYVCSGCGIIQAEETTDIYDEKGKPTAEQRAAKDWNEVVEYINELSIQTHKKKGMSLIPKIYIVVDACSGEDYSVDDPTILFVSSNYDKAKEFFDNEISNWEDDMEDYESNVEEYAEGLVYECTDFEGDSHRIMKLVTEEIK